MLSLRLLLLLLLWDVGSHGFPAIQEIQEEDAELVEVHSILHILEMQVFSINFSIVV